MKKRCLALYSGGLDSILAIKIMEEQGIEVIPLFFCTPFFGFSALRDPGKFVQMHMERYGIRIQVHDYSQDMISIIAQPRHGFGKHLNPCIDCKIGMLKRSRALMEELDASFVITGEVLGQRPMSQRRDTMRIIEKESGMEDLLLRPLCARNLQETKPEREGIVRREALWDLRGRGRKQQIERALKYGITSEKIPTPAGGCLLADVQISQRVRETFARWAPSLPPMAELLMDTAGRRFRIDEATMLFVGRNDAENSIISTFRDTGNVFLRMRDVPGPLCIIRGNVTEENLVKAAGICLRYTKSRGVPGQMAVYGSDPDDMNGLLPAPVFPEEFCRSLQD